MGRQSMMVENAQEDRPRYRGQEEEKRNMGNGHGKILSSDCFPVTGINFLFFIPSQIVILF